MALRPGDPASILWTAKLQREHAYLQKEHDSLRATQAQFFQRIEAVEFNTKHAQDVTGTVNELKTKFDAFVEADREQVARYHELNDDRSSKFRTLEGNSLSSAKKYDELSKAVRIQSDDLRAEMGELQHHVKNVQTLAIEQHETIIQLKTLVVKAETRATEIERSTIQRQADWERQVFQMRTDWERVAALTSTNLEKELGNVRAQLDEFNAKMQTSRDATDAEPAVDSNHAAATDTTVAQAKSEPKNSGMKKAAARQIDAKKRNLRKPRKIQPTSHQKVGGASTESSEALRGPSDSGPEKPSQRYPSVDAPSATLRRLQRQLSIGTRRRTNRRIVMSLLQKQSEPRLLRNGKQHGQPSTIALPIISEDELWSPSIEQACRNTARSLKRRRGEEGDGRVLEAEREGPEGALIDVDHAADSIREGEKPLGNNSTTHKAAESQVNMESTQAESSLKALRRTASHLSTTEVMSGAIRPGPSEVILEPREENQMSNASTVGRKDFEPQPPPRKRPRARKRWMILDPPGPPEVQGPR